MEMDRSHPLECILQPWTPSGMRKRGRPKETWETFHPKRNLKTKIGHGVKYSNAPRTDQGIRVWLMAFNVQPSTKRIKITRLEKRSWSLLGPIFFPRIDDSHCDRIHSAFIAVHCILTMVMWEISQWLGEKIVWGTA